MVNAYRTILPWMAQETQYWSFRYILGTAQSVKTEASEISPARFKRDTLAIRSFSGNDMTKLLFSLRALLSFHGFSISQVLCVPRAFLDGCKRTDSSRFNHVTDSESLDCLVLRGATSAVRATDRADVTTALLVATTVRKRKNDISWLASMITPSVPFFFFFLSLFY